MRTTYYLMMPDGLASEHISELEDVKHLVLQCKECYCKKAFVPNGSTLLPKCDCGLEMIISDIESEM